MDDFSKWTTGITVEQRCWNRVYNSPRKPRRFIYTPAFHQLIRGLTCLSACHPLYFHSSRSPPPCLLIESRLVLFRRGIARIFRARSAFGHTRTGGTYHRGKMRPRQINLRRHPQSSHLVHPLNSINDSRQIDRGDVLLSNKSFSRVLIKWFKNDMYI